MGKVYIEERAVELAHYIIDSKDTVRGAAKKFGISKSTVHKDVTERLRKINPSLAEEARKPRQRLLKQQTQLTRMLRRKSQGASRICTMPSPGKEKKILTAFPVIHGGIRRLRSQRKMLNWTRLASSMKMYGQ